MDQVDQKATLFYLSVLASFLHSIPFPSLLVLFRILRDVSHHCFLQESGTHQTWQYQGNLDHICRVKVAL